MTRKAEGAASADEQLDEFASFHEGYVRDRVTLADTKAAILFGVTTTYLAFLLSKHAFHNWLLEAPCHWPPMLAWAAAVTLAAGSALAAWVIAPRLRSTGEGLIFFGAVRKYPDGSAYAAAIRAATGDKLTDARLQHAYDVSVLCWHKYVHLRRAFWVSVIGLALSLPLFRWLG